MFRTSLEIEQLSPLLVIYGDLELYWGSYSVKHFIATARALKKRGWRDYIPTFNDPRDNATYMEARMAAEFGGRAPDVILFLQDFGLLDTTLWPRTFLRNTKYLCWYDDTPRGASFEGWKALLGADILLPTYEYLVQRIAVGDLASKPRIWMPHSALPAFVLPFNINPQAQVLLVGMVMSGYPLREQVKARIDRGDSRLTQYSHPGWQVGPSFSHIDDFANAMNRFLACILDGSANNFVVAKVFEVPATGSLLLMSDDLRDALLALGFEDGRHYLSFNSSSLDATVDWVLLPANRPQVDKIRAAGQAVAHARHLTVHRVDAIHLAALEAARAKADDDAINVGEVSPFPEYAKWAWKDERSAEFYRGERSYRRARLLVEHEESRLL